MMPENLKGYHNIVEYDPPLHVDTGSPEDSPIDCPQLRWGYLGWSCWQTWTRRRGYMMECPVANKTGDCPAGEYEEEE